MQLRGFIDRVAICLPRAVNVGDHLDRRLQPKVAEPIGRINTLPNSRA
jgi:hypothetical protein